MALAYIVTLEKDLPELAAYTKTGAGKALARESEKLGFAARRKNVNAITSLLSENQEILKQQMIEEGFDPSKMRFPEEVWHPAAEGVAVTAALIDYVSTNLNDFKQPNPILRDLKAVQAILVAADAAKVRFHFSKTVL